MKIHILGIGGTFMGGIAMLARQLGYEVSGSDANLYPPMSTQLEDHGITVMEGYDASHLDPAPDVVVVGNVMTRGNPAVEYMLERGLYYCSGPAFLYEHVLKGRWVLGVAGTHGKTTTASLLTWILEEAGLSPGFLIGGIPENFGISARLGDTPFFVVEADEYDTAFFDKRSKFVHYRPRTLILNNLEFDHADIFPDLESIQRQFHHLLRMVPANGLIIAPDHDVHIDEVLDMGCWTPQERFALDDDSDALWTARNIAADLGAFDVYCGGQQAGRVSWPLYGKHNISNALAAIAAARHAGVPVSESLRALENFKCVKRRMELRAVVNEISVYDDFAHHPTAIQTTLEGVRQRVNAAGGGRVIAVVEPRSNTMRMGVHQQTLADAVAGADEIYFYRPPDLEWDLNAVARSCGGKVTDNVDSLVNELVSNSLAGDQIVIMSNGAFGGIHDKLISALQRHNAA